MKLENWEKLDGYNFDVLGITLYFKDAQYNANTNRYSISISDTMLSIKNPIMMVYLDLRNMEIDIEFDVAGVSSNSTISCNRKITKDHIKNPTIFVQTLAGMMMGDKVISSGLYLLAEVEKLNSPRRSAMVSGGAIGTTIWGTTTVLPTSGLSGSSGNLW